MLTEDAPNNGGSNVTQFDLARMESLEIGESMTAESGQYSVIRYRHDYTLLFGDDVKEFDTVYKIVAFLNNEKS